MAEITAMIGTIAFLALVIAFFLLLLTCVYAGRYAYWLKQIYYQGGNEK